MSRSDWIHAATLLYMFAFPLVGIWLGRRYRQQRRTARAGEPTRAG